MIEVPMSLLDAAAGLRRGDFSSVELTQAVLNRADDLDQQLGAYLTRTDDTALAAAARADRELAEGVDRGPLQGVPFGVKDILATADAPTTAQSNVLDRAWGEGADAPVVTRVRAAGAVLTGKTTTMEFAIGLPDPTKDFPFPRNPWNLETWPGGSSSGTGAAVAAGLILAGFGTDTGGSIRIPAAYCGVTGLMPTYGRVPKSGCAPLGFSLDHIGPLARTARDCAAVLGVIAGYDASDPTSIEHPVPDYLAGLAPDLHGLRIGVERVNHFPANSDPAAGTCLEAAVGVLEQLGATVVEVILPHYPEVVMAARITMSAEALAYHRNDLQHRWKDYAAGTRSTIGQAVCYSAADYVQAQRVRRVAQSRLADLFDEVDVVATPAAVTGAPSYESLLDRAGAPLSVLESTIFTSYWDAVGNPALVVPMGFTGSRLPLSLQLAARPFGEATLVRVGDAYQTVTDWHRRLPPLLSAAAV